MSKNKEDTSTFPALGRTLLWVDNKKNVKRIVYGLYIVCALLFAADFVYLKKTYLPVENIPGFYAFYGFFMCAALVICARAMRVILKRPEDYYAPNDVESEEHPEEQLGRIDHNG